MKKVCAGIVPFGLSLGLSVGFMAAWGQAQEEGIREKILAVHHPSEVTLGKNEAWIPQMAAEAAIDYQQERASIFQTHKVVHNEPLQEKMFETGALMRFGK